MALLINVSSILNKFLFLNTCCEERNFENATANPKVAILLSSGHSQSCEVSSACTEDKNSSLVSENEIYLNFEVQQLSTYYYLFTTTNFLSIIHTIQINSI